MTYETLRSSSPRIGFVNLCGNFCRNIQKTSNNLKSHGFNPLNFINPLNFTNPLNTNPLNTNKLSQLNQGHTRGYLHVTLGWMRQWTLGNLQISFSMFQLRSGKHTKKYFTSCNPHHDIYTFSYWQIFWAYLLAFYLAFYLAYLLAYVLTYKNYWTCPFIVSLPIKIGDFPYVDYVSLPEGINHVFLKHV